MLLHRPAFAQAWACFTFKHNTTHRGGHLIQLKSRGLKGIMYYQALKVRRILVGALAENLNIKNVKSKGQACFTKVKQQLGKKTNPKLWIFVSSVPQFILLFLG